MKQVEKLIIIRQLNICLSVTADTWQDYKNGGYSDTEKHSYFIWCAKVRVMVDLVNQLGFTIADFAEFDKSFNSHILEHLKNMSLYSTFKET